MKLAEVDWSQVLRSLPAWETLSPAARRAFLKIEPGTAAAPQVLGAAANELVAEGFVARPGPRGKLYPHAPALHPLLVAFRAMARLRPLDGRDGPVSPAYLQDQLSTEETNALSGEPHNAYWANHHLSASRVSSVDWVLEFLATTSQEQVRKWEQERMPRTARPRLGTVEVASAVRGLVQALAASPGGRPLREVPELLAGAGPDLVSAALAAGLRYLLVFVSLHGSELEPVVGVLPSIVRRMGPPPPPPTVVAPSAVFEAPYRISDMTAVLVEAAAEPIPVRGTDLRPYVRAQKAIAARLLPLPAWADALLSVTADEIDDDDEDEGDAAQAVEATVRIGLAMDVLHALKLVKVAHSGERYRLSATPAGRAWLALSEGERLKQVMRAMRESTQRNPGWWHGSEQTIEFFGLRLSFGTDDKAMDLRRALTAALLSLPADGMVELDAFARHQAQTANPFLAPGTEKLRARGGFSGAPRTREGWETLWEQVLTGFLRMRVVPLAGARLGKTGGGVGIALTDAGRYLLGAAADFHLAAPPAGEVVVQPDFEVVFLSAAPRLEVELAGFAERTGSGGVGALFRITKASVLRAAEQGQTPDRILKALGEMSRTPVPANVARQVRDWFGATRRVRIRPAVLVECPDSETAARVSAMAGPQATSLTRTLLRLDGDAKSVAALTKKLRAKGIFVQK
jgi:hypothetical protein